MKKLKNIIDSWNMIEKYNIENYIEENNAILITSNEYERLLNSVKNKQYIKNLTL